MNVLFLTLCEYDSIQERDLYTDLLREFLSNGDKTYLISPTERRHFKNTYIIEERNSTILRLKIGNIQKTNIIEKGLSTIMLESAYKYGIKKYFSNVKFDLVLYSTPPITLVGAVDYVKKRDGAKTYLLLKDIFPQNAVDIGLIKTTGVSGQLYNFFKKKEKKLYQISDWIGCMSPANVKYVLDNNPEVNSKNIEVCPNSIEIINKSVDNAKRNRIRAKYGIPINKIVFIYGGNLGKPQGIPFLIKCLKGAQKIENVYFLIVGDGTEYEILEKYVKSEKQKNLKLMRRLPKEDYDTMVGACDVGLIFLDHRFTIPNFPSRLLSYMQAKIPVLCCTDPNTDIGKIIMDNDFGWWCESNSVKGFLKCVENVMASDLKQKGNRAYEILIKKYNVQNAYYLIKNKLIEK